MSAPRHDAEGYWLREAGPRPELSPARGEMECDVLVIGGGFTGLWTAWHLSELEPGARIVLLEGGRCAHGPSGRNGGFVNAMWFGLRTLSERYGEPAAVEIARASQESVDAIGAFCVEHEIDAWWRRAGYLQVSTAPAQDEVWAQAAAITARAGEDDRVRVLSAEEVARRCSSPRFRAGAHYPGAATVQPARLALGLRDRLAAREGVAVHERSRVDRLSAGPWGCLAETGEARVRAAACVLALGAASGALGSPLRGRLTVTSSHIVITRPVPELLGRVGWTAGECITDGRAMLHYFRTTPDGRIAFGWGGGRIAYGSRLHGRSEVDAGIARRVVADLRGFFPGLDAGDVEHAWGGPIDVSPSHVPFVTRIRSDRVHAACGYTGNGVGPSHLLGRILASLSLDRRDRLTRLGLVEPGRRVPDGLLGWAGGNAIRSGLLAKEDAEEEGRVAAAHHRALAAVPELIGVHVGR